MCGRPGNTIIMSHEKGPSGVGQAPIPGHSCKRVEKLLCLLAKSIARDQYLCRFEMSKSCLSVQR